MQVLAYVAGLAVCFTVLRQVPHQSRIITGLLALMWSVNGIGYHGLFFSQINPAAYLFAALFLAEALVLLVIGFVVSDLVFKLHRPPWSALGVALVVFSMVIYPSWGWLAGHRYPATPVFGVAPCPTTIFTIGVLLLGSWQKVRWLLVLPVLWAAIGGTAAILMAVPQDYGLIVAGLIAIASVFVRRRRWSQHK